MSIVDRVRSFFGRNDLPRKHWREDKPWKRGTYAENMEPLSGARAYNHHGTFCRYCGDWVVDSAYYAEHNGWHTPRRNSWNWLHPEAKRRDPDDLIPNHDEWLEEIRDDAGRMTRDSLSFSGTGPTIDPSSPRAFHSEEEARATLEPFGCRVHWSPDSGFVINGVCSGSWQLSGSREARREYEQRA